MVTRHEIARLGEHQEQDAVNERERFARGCGACGSRQHLCEFCERVDHSLLQIHAHSRRVCAGGIKQVVERAGVECRRAGEHEEDSE